MTLTNRLTLFFLAALAVVLAAFSVTLYALARSHLYAQLDGRGNTTMDTLVALAEIEPDGLDWEPELRRLPSHWEGDPPVWAIFDETGSRVDGSHASGYQLAEFAQPGPVASRESFHAEWNGDDWRIARQTLVFQTPEAIRSRPGRERHRTLVFVTAWPVAPVREMLRRLAWCLTAVSAAVWLLSGFAGRWVCRRAIVPVSRMTAAAKRITAADLSERLPAPPARDELRDFAVAFNDLLGRLQDSFERQRRFTGEASHQLRTPLTAILGQVEVALRRERDSCEYRRVLTAVGGQAGRLHQIVELLLFLARADGEAAIPEACPTDLREWLPAHIDSTWGEHPRRRDLRVTVPSTDPVWVRVQPILLGQALDNLIDNALKHGPSDGAVEVGVSAAGGAASLRVADRGPGVPADEAAQVFQPFFRSVTARRSGVGGVGLGLAVAARIATAFRGQVALIPNADHGCIAEIVLPIVTQPHTI